MIIMGLNLFPRVVANYSDSAFEITVEKSLSLNIHIVKGAGYFLKGYSDILMFLNKIEESELDGTDYNELLEIINRAIGNMRQAKKVYGKLTSIANDTPYNPVIIDRLLMFDYECFQKENGLNRDIFANVRKYLGNGDVRGIYAMLFANTAKILNELIVLKMTVEREKFPIVHNLWRLNQRCSEVALFGNYVSEILKNVKDIK
jgi:hypothetical protein